MDDVKPRKNSRFSINRKRRRMNNMMNPKRFAMDENGDAFSEMIESDKGGFVSYETYVELVAQAIDGAANREFLEKQVPDLKKALVQILTLASSGNVAGDGRDAFADIVHFASKALSK
jgi:hypothetical protein